MKAPEFTIITDADHKIAVEKARLRTRPTNKKWCDCGPQGPEDGPFFVDGGECSCGTTKEHMHCLRCGGFSQVG